MANPEKRKLLREVREVVDFAEQHGFEFVKRTSKSHVMLAIPGGGPVQIIPGTPGGYSWRRNAEGDIRRKARQWADQQRRAEQKQQREQGSKRGRAQQ